MPRRTASQHNRLDIEASSSIKEKDIGYLFHGNFDKRRKGDVSYEREQSVGDILFSLDLDIKHRQDGICDGVLILVGSSLWALRPSVYIYRASFYTCIN